MTMTTPARTPAVQAEAISIYRAIGGRAALVAAVDSLYGRLLADPELGPFFPGGVGARHRRYVVTILGEALGGPSATEDPWSAPTAAWASAGPISSAPLPTWPPPWTGWASPAT